MTRPESHEIDESAKRLFLSALPVKWIVREQHPDYRVDYLIEPFEEYESTGKYFAVQLKGTKVPRLVDSASAISFSLDTNHLSYFVDKVPLPVVLVVVDVSSNRGWWCSLRSYVLTQLNNSSWREQESVTIRVPISNELKLSELLLSEVHSEYKLLRELNPGSIQAAIKAERKRIESLDSRMEVVDLRATEDFTEIAFKANESFAFELQVNDEEGQQKLQKVLETGQKVEFKDGELNAVGSPLFQQNEYQLSALKVGNELDASVRITICNLESEEAASLYLSGTFRGGTKQCSFDMALPNSPLSIQLEIDYGLKSILPSTQFDIARWHGKDLRLLPHIVPLFNFVSALHNLEAAVDTILQVEIHIEGNLIANATANLAVVKAIVTHSHSITFLHKAHQVAKKLGIPIAVPSDFQVADFTEIETVFQLLENGVFRSASPEATCHMKIGPVGVRQLLAANVVVPLTLSQHKPMSFLRNALDFGPVRLDFSHMTFQFDREDILRRLTEEAAIEPFDIKLTATSDCWLTITRIADINDHASVVVPTDIG